MITTPTTFIVGAGGSQPYGQEAVLREGIRCFLGFAYDPVNLAKLGLKPHLEGFDLVGRFFGSACGLLDGEKAAVRRYFRESITLGGHDQECREVLRALEVFQDQ